MGEAALKAVSKPLTQSGKRATEALLRRRAQLVLAVGFAQSFSWLCLLSGEVRRPPSTDCNSHELPVSSRWLFAEQQNTLVNNITARRLTRTQSQNDQTEMKSIAKVRAPRVAAITLRLATERLSEPPVTSDSAQALALQQSASKQNFRTALSKCCAACLPGH